MLFFGLTAASAAIIVGYAIATIKPGVPGFRARTIIPTVATAALIFGSATTFADASDPLAGAVCQADVNGMYLAEAVTGEYLVPGDGDTVLFTVQAEDGTVPGTADARNVVVRDDATITRPFVKVIVENCTLHNISPFTHRTDVTYEFHVPAAPKGIAA